MTVQPLTCETCGVICSKTSPPRFVVICASVSEGHEYSGSAIYAVHTLEEAELIRDDHNAREMGRVQWSGGYPGYAETFDLNLTPRFHDYDFDECTECFSAFQDCEC